MVKTHLQISTLILKRLALFLSVGILLTFFGCGVKGDLVQKGQKLPSAVGNLTALQQGNEALLSWTIPTVNQDGSPLDNLDQFIVSRLTYRPGEYCKECRDPETGQVNIYLDRPEPAIRIDDRLFLRDSNLPLNQGYRYRITPINTSGEAGAVALVRRIMYPAPQPPSPPEVTVQDRSLRIEWTNTADPSDSGQILGMNIYRAIGEEPFGPQALNSQPITEEEYNDFGLENNQAYRYALRQVIEVDEQTIESALSEPVIAIPKPLL